MSFKHHAARRHRIPRARYRVQGWQAHEAGLKRRGDLGFWIDGAALAGWAAPRRTTPGGQPLHPDRAVQLVPTLRLLGLDPPIPDRTTLSRRGCGFAGRQPGGLAGRGPWHLVLGSTGLQLLGQGEWDEEKHGRARRGWRKLHLGADAVTGEIAAQVLTEGSADDAAQAPAPLGRAEGTIAGVTADGACDGEPVHRAAAARQRDPAPTVVTPPRASAVAGTNVAEASTQRDRHIRLIAEEGRMGWQEATGYGRRDHAEAAIGRHEASIGPRLRARTLPTQRGEVALGVQAPNRMIRVAKPVSIRLA